MNRKALQIGFVAAAIGFLVLFFYLRRHEAEASDTVEVLVLTRDLASGELVEAEALAIRQVPSTDIEDRYVPATEGERIWGHRTSRGLQANQVLLWTDLATTESRRDLAELLRPGMRAITIPVDSRDEVLTRIRPGDRVDLHHTTTTPGGEEGGETTLVLLQNLLILDVGGSTGGEVMDPRAGGTSDVSIGMSTDYGPSLIRAITTGQIRIVPRPDTGFRIVDGIELEDVANEDLIEPAAHQTVRRQR